jgi:surface protein
LISFNKSLKISIFKVNSIHMKTIIALMVTMLSLVSYAQIPITDDNFDTAIEDCLASDSEDGICTNSVYGIMPDWDVSNVTKMNLAFYNKPDFNVDISRWVVSNVTDMTGMFYGGLVFNQDLSNWDVSKVTEMTGMFEITTKFNQDLSTWNVANVEALNAMFRQATAFDQDLSTWDIAKVTNITDMFEDSGLSTDNYDALLTAWSLQAVQFDLKFGAQGTSYCNATAARQLLIDTKGWLITDAGLDCTTASIDTQSKNTVNLYPNPTNGVLYIDTKIALLNITLHDLLGKEVLRISGAQSIDMGSLASGAYLLKLYDGENISIQRVIKNE